MQQVNLYYKIKILLLEKIIEILCYFIDRESDIFKLFDVMKRKYDSEGNKSWNMNVL